MTLSFCHTKRTQRLNFSIPRTRGKVAFWAIRCVYGTRYHAARRVQRNNLVALPIVLGPTGSGKSDLALRIARELGGEIVNCDSLQIYRRFDIGTAKVPEPERGGVPHHLIDLIDAGELFTAGDYARVARAALQEIGARGRAPIVVGGTGFYLRALLEGLFAGPSRDETLRERLRLREQRRPGSLHRILMRLDPQTAARIHVNDRNKTMRALEVRLLEGRPLSTMLERGRTPLAGFCPIKIGIDPPRELLYSRLNTRATSMFERGLIQEVRDLLASGVSPDAKPFESLGYRQALEVVQARLTLHEAIESTQNETRRYAKRQLTWFRKERDVHWLHAFGDSATAQDQSMEIIRTTTKV